MKGTSYNPRQTALNPLTDGSTGNTFIDFMMQDTGQTLSEQRIIHACKGT